jgi:alpha-glucosidase
VGARRGHRGYLSLHHRAALGTQYLWGDDLLVAPVTRRGATHWTVYLPAGTWHDFWTQDRYHGPAGVTVAAPLEHVPLFVRGGAIIPLGPVAQYDGEQPLDEVTLLAYPEAESSFTLYEDDGWSNAYRDGGWVETRFDCAADATCVTFRIHPPQGDASLITADRHYALKLRAPDAPREVTVDGAPHVCQHDGRFVIVQIPRTPCSGHITW